MALSITVSERRDVKMVKNAYLIIAHHNWEQVKLQLKMLDSPNNDFFIHVNEKAKMPEKEALEKATAYSKVYFSDRTKVVWGGYGIFKAATLLLEKATEVCAGGGYDYFHLMSGSDLPLKSVGEIDDFLTVNMYLNQSGGRYKTNYVDVHAPEANPKMLARVTQYNLCVPFWKNRFNAVEFAARKINRIGYYLQKAFRVDRFRRSGQKVVHGSGWWIISDELADYILKHREEIERQYSRMTFSADEFVVQTLVYNSEFKNSVYSAGSPLMWEIDWERGDGKGSPHIFTIEDASLLEKSEKLYARKFDIRVDEKIVRYVENMRGS